MKFILVYFIVCFDNFVLSNNDDVDIDVGDETTVEEVETNNINAEEQYEKIKSSNCWMKLNSPELFKIMDEIDERYADIRKAVQKAVIANNFDASMINGLISSRGAALRELFKQNHQAWLIPSGINLGGFCMVRMQDSVLFFHRMKLRDNTTFRVDYLENNLADMEMYVHLTLHDLRLRGAYERSLTDSDRSVLIYAPTFGEVDFLLKNVRYRMIARYRLINKRLNIELVSSEIFMENILMSYINQLEENHVIKMEKKNIETFVSKLKIDFDKWLKDYFNDYLMYASVDGLDHIEELEQYDKEKATILEEYADNAITTIKNRIRQLGASTIKVPSFTFKTIHGLNLRMYDGVLHGLDSMYRRSVVTGVNQMGIRKVDTIVGFSNLKVVHKYEAMIPSGVPPLNGAMILSANELTAHLALAMVNDPESIDIDIEVLEQIKSQSLTVEGAANLMISSFRNILEHQIISVMTNSLHFRIGMIRSLPKCVPFVPGMVPIQQNKTQELNRIRSSNELDDKLKIRRTTTMGRIVFTG